MTRGLRVRTLVVATACAGAVLLRAQTTPPPQSGQTFRTAADVVMVDVSVKQGNTPVAGLTVKDFELRDNGVLQRVEQVDATAVPIDLTLVVDVSGFPGSRLIRPPMKPLDTSAVRADVAKVAALLRPTDKLRVLAVDTYVHQLMPLSSAAALPPLTPPPATDGLASTYDALLAAILQPAEPNRRRVVIANISVFDTMSTADAATIREVASQTDTLLHIVLAQQAVGKRAVTEEFQCLNAGVCTPTARSWMPHTWLTIQPVAGERPPDQPNAPPPPVPQLLVDGQLLQAGAIATGGALHQGEMMSAPSLAGTFAKAFDDFRQSYVLRYTPDGVKRPGWHDIKVTVPAGRGYTIHARNGYAIDTPPVAKPIAAPVGKTPFAVIMLPDLMDAYARADYATSDDALGRVIDPTRWIKDFDSGATVWPGSLRSEAVFALELAATGVFTRAKITQDAARDLLQRYSRLVRPPIEPDDFERRWLRAVLALLQGRIAPEAAGPFVDRALARFPQEPRFLLAQAIVTDQLWRGFGIVSFGDRPTPTEIPIKQASTVIDRYQAAANASPEVATEARIRLGWFLFRVGRPADALAELDAAPPSPEDVGMEFLRHLFKAQVLASQEKLSEAIVEARTAHVLVPEAQSARVVLMNALALRGDAADAEAVATNIETAARTADPWWGYWLGDFRWYPDALLTLRTLAK